MKCTIITTLLAASTFSAYAGPETMSPAAAPYQAPAASGTSFFDDMKDWAVRPTLTSRLRLESRSAQNREPGNAGTISVSPGLTTKSFGGFSGLIEGEFTYAFYDEYNTSTQPQLYPNNPTKTTIADPQTEEINQAYLQYKNFGLTVKAGRQRIILDKAAHVGNVGWRQNEQTYDGVTVGYKKDAYSATLGYINQVNRIFGNEANGPAKELQGHGILANFSTKIDTATVGGYAYLLDFYEDSFGGANGNTFGIHAASNGVYAEAAFQENSGNNPNESQAFYGHLKYSQKVAGGMGTVGLEYLGEDFTTPLATVHAYNGFADVFIGQRLGLNTNWEGLSNFYASYVKKGLPGGFVFKGFLHYFMDQGFGDTYGWEADAVLVKKLSKQATLVSKFAYFFADNDTTYVNDVAQASVQIDFKF